MPPQAAKKQPKDIQLGIKPSIKASSVTFKLEDISVCDDSSWRDLDREAVDQHKAAIRAGKHGDTMFAGASFLHNLTSGIDGKQLLNDGLQYTCALMETKMEAAALGNLQVWYDAVTAKNEQEDPSEWEEQLRDLPPWCNALLLEVYVKGVTGYSYTYPGDDRTIHKCIQIEKHEETNQRYDKTDLFTKIKNTTEQGHFFLQVGYAMLTWNR